MLKVIVILVLVWVTGTVVLGLCEAASRADRWEEEHREEFDGYKWCEDDCYICNNQGRCERAAKKER